MPLLLLAVIVTISAYGHVDTVLRLTQSELKGLPEKYRPAFFSHSERKLQIGHLSVTIPSCLWQHFSTAKKSEFRFWASWYHTRSTLPPYIALSVKDSNTKTETQLLINLDTLEPIKLWQFIQISENSWQEKDQPIEQACRSQWVFESTK